MMDVRERILAAMSWQEPDRIPLTIYDWMIPTGAAERELREMGLGIITRLPAHRVEHREVQYDSTEYWEGGLHMLRRTIRTPVGDVSQVAQLDAAYGSTWILEHLIRRFIDQKSAVNPCVWHPWGFFGSFPPVGIDQQLFGHWESPFVFY